MNIHRSALNNFFVGVISLTIAFFSVSRGWAGEKVFDLVTLGNDGSLPQDGLYSGDRSKITPDGRYVVYRSGETKLVTPNTTGYQIFLRDRKNGTTELISVNNLGQFGNSSSDWATISNDGCKVVYQSYSSNLVTSDTNGLPDVFLRNRCVSPMTTTRLNVNYQGGESLAASYTPAISGNGRYVAFNSYSTDLVPGVTREDLLYLRDLDQQTTILLSASIVDGLGEQAWNPSLSYDGSRIAFTSASTELVGGVLASWNVFLYDANSEPHIRLVSSDTNGNPQDFANGNQPVPGISDDGHYVSFYSNAHNLVSNDTNNKYDIFVKNVDTNEIWRATESSTGVEANIDTQENSTLSYDGTWVTYWTEATNLASDTQNISRVVLLHNIWTHETRQILGNDSERVPKISGDLYGRFVSNFWAEKLDDSLPHSGVYVYDRHRLPVAVATIDTSTRLPVQVGDTVALDGSSSNNNANVNSTTNFFAPKETPSLIYTWTQTEGNAVTFNDPHAAKPTFTTPADGKYTFKLIVNDTVEDSLPDTVTFQVGSGSVIPNQKPVADAGLDQTGVEIGEQVVLDGSQSSDPDDSPSSLIYSWTQIAGLSLSLTGGNTVSPSFTPTMSGSYSFRLVVNDGKDSSSPDVVTIVVGDATASNIQPIAIAGDDQTAVKGSVVTLNGGQSYDPDSSDNLSFQWLQVAGPAVKLKNKTTITPNFTPIKIGSYSFQLVVKDSGLAVSLPSVVTVTVSGGVGSNNELPVAVPEVAPGQTALINAVVRLTGVSSNDPDSGPKTLKYQWSQSDGPGKVKLANAKTISPSFTPKLPGFYVFDLAVFDGLDWSTPESVTVLVDSNITINSPLADEIWPINSTQSVSFTAVGINPSTTLKTYLLSFNASKLEFELHPLKKKPRATETGFSFKIPNNLKWQTEIGFIVICANSEYCGYSEIFGIQ